MAQDSRPCRGCGKEIKRVVQVAPIKHYCGPPCRPRCSVADCLKAVHTKGMCSAHATRAARYGDPLAPKVREPNEGECTAPGCTEPMRKTRLCANHYGMLRRFGEIRDWKFKWGQGGYVPTHSMLRRRRGAAENYACVDCGNPAEEWSYNGGSLEELVDPERGATYTRDLTFYSPRCVRCHRIFDDNPIATRGGGAP